MAKALGDEKSSIRVASARALGAMGAEAKVALTTLLQDDEEFVRVYAANALWQK